MFCRRKHTVRLSAQRIRPFTRVEIGPMIRTCTLSQSSRMEPLPGQHEEGIETPSLLVTEGAAVRARSLMKKGLKRQEGVVFRGERCARIP